MSAVIVTAVLIAAGLVWGLIATAMAPVGYEDEAGFHYGKPGGESVEGVPPLTVPEPKAA